MGGADMDLAAVPGAEPTGQRTGAALRSQDDGTLGELRLLKHRLGGGQKQRISEPFCLRSY